MYFHGARFSNYEAWLSDPVHIKPSAQVVWPVVGQEILNGDVGGGFQGIQITSGFFQLWRASGITSELQLYTTAIGGLVMAAAMFFAGWFHYHKAAPKLEWFQNVESMLNHHLAGLLGLGSLSWAGHQIHVSLPINKLLDAGVDPKEIPLPHEFLLNRQIMQDLYPSFAKGLAPFFTLQWGEYSDFLTFNGGSCYWPLEDLYPLDKFTNMENTLMHRGWTSARKSDSIPSATKKLKIFGHTLFFSFFNMCLYTSIFFSLWLKGGTHVFSSSRNLVVCRSAEKISEGVDIFQSFNSFDDNKNSQFVIKDLENFEKILEIPNNSLDNLQINFNNLPSIWFSYGHLIWNSIRNNDQNFYIWKFIPEQLAIYVIKCIKTGKMYYGQTQNIKERFKNTYTSLQQGNHCSLQCQQDWQKFGPKNFVFQILFLDDRLASESVRKKIESYLVYTNKETSYNDLARYSKEDFLQGEILIKQFEKIDKILHWFEAGMSISKKTLSNLYKSYEQAGLYVILCLITKKVYIGETQNLKTRFKDTRKNLYNGNYSCKLLLEDVQKYGIANFCFIPIYFGKQWESQKIRREAEKKLIEFNKSIVYNKHHASILKELSKSSQQKNALRQAINGFPIAISINGEIYKSKRQAQIFFNITKKELNKRLENNIDFPDWKIIETFAPGLGIALAEVENLPKIVYLVDNKVFKSKRSLIRNVDFGNLSKTGVSARFQSSKFPNWKSMLREEFIQMKNENPEIDFEFMWQRCNDHPKKE